MLGKHILAAIFLVIVVLIVYNVTTSHKEKYVLAPIPANLVAKHFHENWSIDMHNHVLRIVRRDYDATTIESLLGVVKYSGKKKINFKVPTSRSEELSEETSEETSVLDVYTYDTSEKKLGNLVYSISNPIDVSLGHGEFFLEKGHYLPLLRVGGTLKKSWMKRLRVSKNKNARANVFGQMSTETSSNELSIVPSNETQIDLGPVTMTPPSGGIVKNACKFDVMAGNTVTLYCQNIPNTQTVISAKVMGNRVDEIIGGNDPTKREWVVNADSEVIFIENIYNLAIRDTMSKVSSVVVTVK